MKPLVACDLFCGAGGTSTGLAQTCESAGLALDLTAVNHWSVAIETHSANHPKARHLCESLDSIEPRKLIRGKLDLLWASPECTHHSNARGGKPCSDQSRASAWHVVRWADALSPRVILVENVREFRDWGPLSPNGKPIPSRKGDTFRAWCHAIASLGYTVTHAILNAADHGDPTTRKRLFVAAVRGRRAFRWPQATHRPSEGPDLFTGSLARWRAAREVIDWTLTGEPITSRKRPLSPNTLRRIEAGLKRFNGNKPFLVPYYGAANEADSVEAPVRTLTAKDRLGLVMPEGQPSQRADIRFRMLQPGELAAAMSFPASYKFVGNKSEVVKQIGNAVAVGTARALCGSALEMMGEGRKRSRNGRVAG